MYVLIRISVFMLSMHVRSYMFPFVNISKYKYIFILGKILSRLQFYFKNLINNTTTQTAPNSRHTERESKYKTPLGNLPLLEDGASFINIKISRGKAVTLLKSFGFDL